MLAYAEVSRHCQTKYVQRQYADTGLGTSLHLCELELKYGEWTDNAKPTSNDKSSGC